MITIWNNKGRLTAEEIERMVKEADQYKAKGDAQCATISAKNNLESYALSMNSPMDDEKVTNKM